MKSQNTRTITISKNITDQGISTADISYVANNNLDKRFYGKTLRAVSIIGQIRPSLLSLGRGKKGKMETIVIFKNIIINDPDHLTRLLTDVLRHIQPHLLKYYSILIHYRVNK